LCGQQAKYLSTPYLTVHHISHKHIIPYGGPRVSIFRKLNNKVIFNYLITNKSYLFISLMYLSFVCDPIGFYNVDNNIKSHI